MLCILDTDHISLLQRGHPQVAQRLFEIPLAQRAVTIITVAEQVKGRLAVVSAARDENEATRAFGNLQDTLEFYQAIQVLPYLPEAQTYFQQLRQQKIRIGTQDLRIAAIALANQATLVTRNGRDFSQIPGLLTADWSV